jgi:hypothetical protein
MRAFSEKRARAAEGNRAQGSSSSLGKAQKGSAEPAVGDQNGSDHRYKLERYEKSFGSQG